jgi:hypothetical protein
MVLCYLVPGDFDVPAEAVAKQYELNVYHATALTMIEES